MDKITFSKTCEYCGAKFTTPTFSKRYCSKRCVKAAYVARKKETTPENSQTAVVQRLRLHLKTEYFSVSQTAVILGLSRQTVYRMIWDGRIKACHLSSRTTRIHRNEIDRRMSEMRLLPNSDSYYTIDEIMNITRRSRSWTFKLIKTHGIRKSIKYGKRHYDREQFDRMWTSVGRELRKKDGWVTFDDLIGMFGFSKTYARFFLAFHHISKKVILNTEFYSSTEISAITGCSDRYYCSVHQAMEDYGLTYDQVKWYIMKGMLEPVIDHGEIKYRRDLFEQAAHIDYRTDNNHQNK